MNEYELREIIAENLSYYRKENNLTQLQLAEKLNYSDKAISKWERGESIPDVIVLMEIVELYGITLNDLTQRKKVKPTSKRRRNQTFITVMGFGAIWLIATFVFVLLKLFMPELQYSWLSFIYALPISMIVLVVFHKLWNHRLFLFLALSVLYWTLPLAIYLSVPIDNLWLLFIAVIPLQILTILWFIFRKK